MTLSINKSDNAGGAWEFRLTGEIDISNAQDFKQQVEAALAEKKQDVILELSALNYIDSSGLGVIIGIYSMAKKDGLQVKVENPKDNVKKLLNISGLIEILC